MYERTYVLAVDETGEEKTEKASPEAASVSAELESGDYKRGT